MDDRLFKTYSNGKGKAVLFLLIHFINIESATLDYTRLGHRWGSRREARHEGKRKD